MGGETRGLCYGLSLVEGVKVPKLHGEGKLAALLKLSKRAGVGPFLLLRRRRRRSLYQEEALGLKASPEEVDKEARREVVDNYHFKYS